MWFIAITKWREDSVSRFPIVIVYVSLKALQISLHSSKKEYKLQVEKSDCNSQCQILLAIIFNLYTFLEFVT